MFDEYPFESGCKHVSFSFTAVMLFFTICRIADMSMAVPLVFDEAPGGLSYLIYKIC